MFKTKRGIVFSLLIASVGIAILVGHIRFISGSYKYQPPSPMTHFSRLANVTITATMEGEWTPRNPNPDKRFAFLYVDDTTNVVHLGPYTRGEIHCLYLAPNGKPYLWDNETDALIPVAAYPEEELPDEWTLRFDPETKNTISFTCIGAITHCGPYENIIHGGRLFVDDNTKIVYTGSSSQRSFELNPYTAPNGEAYKYDAENNALVPIQSYPEEFLSDVWTIHLKG